MATLPKKQACPGSCHCGFIKYIVYLTLPHSFSGDNRPRSVDDQEIYRCNCNTCYKLNFFHVHPAHQRNDFIILSPLDLDKELSIYQCNSHLRKFYFCPKCGVRCFTLSGEGEIELDKEENREVWRVKWDGENATRPYVSVNGTTIDYKEEFDLRVLTEEKKVMYLDDRTEPEEKKAGESWDRPHWGGCY